MRMVIDKAGRVVVPKALREQLGLTPGTELDARVEDGELVAKPLGPEVVLVRNEHGRLVARTTGPTPPLTNDYVIDFIHRMREERERHKLGLDDVELEWPPKD